MDVTVQFASLLGLALLDSLNPSALLMTMYLLTQSRANTRVVTYLSAIFITYLSVGVMLMLGLEALLRFENVLESPVAYTLQGGRGAVMLIYSLVAPTKLKRASSAPSPGANAFGATFLLGVTITAVEFPTAFPYLGAIGILTSADSGAARWLPILLIYNLIFILPPTSLLVAHNLLGKRLETRFERWRERLQKEARETMLWIVGIVGFFLLTDALSYFDFFGLVSVPSTYTWMRVVAVGHN